MKTILFAGTILVIVVRCHGAGLPPADSFRLTVEQLVENHACRVVQLKVEARPTAEMLEILYEPENGGSSIILAPTLKGKARETKMVLASMLVDGDTNSVCHVATVTQSGEGTSTTSRRSYDLAPGTALKSVVRAAHVRGGDHDARWYSARRFGFTGV